MRITFFRSLFDTEAAEHEITWQDLVASIRAPATFQAKADCPLIKLARFGPHRNAKGFLRHNANVTAITGIELDYDGEAVPMAHAAEQFRKVGLEALLYTSASNTPDKPRWRALLPLSGEYGPEYREAFAEAANAVLGGICAPESNTLSQAFYVGLVARVPYEAVHVPGAFLDTVTPPSARPLRTTASLDVPEFEKVNLAALPIPADVLALITNPPPKGERSEALMSAANGLARAQVPPETILRILADPDNPISSKALERRTVSEAMDWLARFTVAKALERHPPLATIFPTLAGRPIDKRKLFHDAKALRGEPTPARWIIRGILEQECFAVLFGASESGKSLIALDMACCVASGEPFNERQTMKGSVAYISGEGNTGLARRLRAWELAHKDAKQLEDNMLILTSRAVHFRDPDQWRELLAALDEQHARIPLSLITIDTYARANAGGDENSAKDAAEFVRYCDYLKDRYRCTVLLIGHTGTNNAERIMGSTVIRNAADVEMSFRRLEQDEPKNVSALKCTKMKDAERFDELYFQLTPQALGWFDPETLEQIKSWTFTELDPPDALPHTPTNVLFCQCLGLQTIAYEKVRTAFFQLYRAGNVKAKQKAWDRALAKALEREWCSRETDHIGDKLLPHPPAMYRDGIDLSKFVTPT